MGSSMAAACLGPSGSVTSPALEMLQNRSEGSPSSQSAGGLFSERRLLCAWQVSLQAEDLAGSHSPGPARAATAEARKAAGLLSPEDFARTASPPTAGGRAGNLSGFAVLHQASLGLGPFPLGSNTAWRKRLHCLCRGWDLSGEGRPPSNPFWSGLASSDPRPAPALARMGSSAQTLCSLGWGFSNRGSGAGFRWAE